MRSHMKKVFEGSIALCVLTVLIATMCLEEKPIGKKTNVVIVTSIFPLYDIARAVGGDRADVSMLLPPGVEAHTFEPRPSDVGRIANADLFFYVGAGMEPWAQSLIDGADNEQLAVLDASSEVESEGNQGIDPHLWLDFTNDEKLADTVAAILGQKDPKNAGYFSGNAEAYKKQLSELDSRYKETLKNCKTRTFITGGHNAFTYLAGRYNLTGISAYGLSPDSEPTPKTLTEIDDLVKEHGVRYILFEDIVSPKVAQAIAQDTGAKTLVFSPGENLPKEDFDRGVTFISLMEKDLETLNIALECK